MAVASKGAPVFLQVLASCVKAAERAGDVIRAVHGSKQLHVVDKTGEDDLQTLADRLANTSIVASLKTQFPGLAVIAEEGDVHPDDRPDLLVDGGHPEVVAELVAKVQGDIPSTISQATLADMTVWVDPLDGTKEFTEGLLDHVTCLIGVAVGDAAVGGVIHQPFFRRGEAFGRTVYGAVGLGVGGHLNRALPPDGQRIVTTSRSHSTGLVSDVLQSVSPTSVLAVGGSGHKVLLLIEGLVHAYVFPSPGCKRWDTCGPEAILHALGGLMTDFYGRKYNYSKDCGQVADEWGILATSVSSQHADYLSRVPQHLVSQIKDYYKRQ